MKHCQTIKSNELPLALSQHPVGITERIDGTERLLPPDNPQNPTTNYPEVFSIVTDNLASAIIGGHQRDPAISKIVSNLEIIPRIHYLEYSSNTTTPHLPDTLDEKKHYGASKTTTPGNI